jgi:hypothetical protein
MLAVCKPKETTMTPIFETAIRTAAIGAGATLAMDAWLFFLKARGVPVQSFAMLGRWISHWRDGVFRHDAIAKAAPVKGELLLGWSVHYAIGISFAVLLAAVAGPSWMRAPTLPPALLTGIATVIAPLLIMQPAMGAGLASSKTKTPLRNCLKSIATHTVFGLGLYGAAMAVAAIA